MARIRTIKPEFWTDSKIVQLPLAARLLFIGMWNFCDDEGYIKDDPLTIKLQVLPNDPDDVEKLLDLLVSAELLERCEDDDGECYLLIKNFLEHQKISNPAKSKIKPKIAYKKKSVPAKTRRDIALKYGCKPGEKKKVECYYCGEPGEIEWFKKSDGNPSYWVAFDLELDHFVSEFTDGVQTAENFVLACRKCNRSKRDKNGIQFAEKSMKIEKVENPLEDSRGLPLGMEGNGKEYNPPPTRAHARGDEIPIPETFRVTGEMLEFAAEHDLTDLEVLGRFTAHFIAANRKSGWLSANWPTEWRNYLLRPNVLEFDRYAPRQQPDKPLSATQRTAANWQANRERLERAMAEEKLDDSAVGSD